MSKLDDDGLVAELCNRLAGGEGMKEICADAHMPARSQVYERMASDEEFRTRIACAREAQQDYEADNIVDMADEATADDWQVVKLRIFARQWRAAKLAPKKYGDKLGVDHTSDGKAITGLTVGFVGVGEQTPEDAS